MLLAQVFGWTLFIFGLLLSFQGLWLVSRALWPTRVLDAATRCRNNAVASFFIGLPITLVVSLVGVATASRLGAPGQMAAFLLVSLYFIYANVGVAGLATHLGQRLSSPVDEERPWRATVRGGIVLSLAWLPPILGWLVILPVSLMIGAGAVTMALFAGAGPLPLPAPHARELPSLNPLGASLRREAMGIDQ